MTAGIVRVVGPPLSGASAVAAALRRRLAGCHVTESPAGPADVVVFVVSAAAPMTHCDAALLGTADPDAVVAVVAKIDVHRNWQEVLEANRTALCGHASGFGATRWCGVAADPQIGPPVIEPLVEAVAGVLGDSGRAARSRLRAARERAERAAQRNMFRAEARQTRIELAAEVRVGVVALRAELQHRAAQVSGRDIACFEEEARGRVAETASDIEDLVHGRLAGLCRRQGLPVPAFPPARAVWEGLPPPHRPATDNVAVMFAATFGLGVALTLGRLAELMVGASPWALAASGAMGLALALWVARTRRLIAARLAADRWVTEVSAGLRSALEDRVLAAESSLLAAIAAEGRTPN